MTMNIMTKHGPMIFDGDELEEVRITAESISFVAQKENGQQIFILKSYKEEKHNA